jgi:hypothetical protein
VFSGNYKNYSTNFSLASNWISNGDVYLTSFLVMSYKMATGLVIRPSLDYNFTTNQLMRYGTVLEKRVVKMSFSATIERNVQINANNLLLNFKYDLDFARTYFSVSHNNNGFNSSQTAQGSLAFGGDNGYVKAGNNSALGKGGILLYPFLDLNHNGKRDAGEPTVLVKDVKVSGGTAITSEKDSIVRISDLNAFVHCNLQFSDADLESISWRFKHKTYQILVDPNQYKKVEVPVLVVGEVSGMIYLNTEGNLKGQDRITVQIYNNHNQVVAQTLSESDGYFNYLGLKPGNYTVRIDDNQLSKLEYQSSPMMHKVFIKVAEEGTVVEGLDFQIKHKEAAEIIDAVFPEDNIQVKEETTSEKIVVKPIESISNKDEVFYSIQVGVYKDHSIPKELGNLEPVFYEDTANGNVQFYYGFFRTRERALIAKNTLLLHGIRGTSIVAYQFGKKIDESLSEAQKVATKENSIPVKMEAETTIRKNTSFGKISDIKEDFFGVQIGVFRNYVPSNHLLNFNPVYYEIIAEDRIRYISGKFKTFQEARKMKNEINEKGIKDAFVVKYIDGLRPDLSKK